MKCDIKCYWNYNNECCPESNEEYTKATPNNTECPSYLRYDFEEHLWQVYDDIRELINHRNIKELEEIKAFIKNQRKEGNN